MHSLQCLCESLMVRDYTHFVIKIAAVSCERFESAAFHQLSFLKGTENDQKQRRTSTLRRAHLSGRLLCGRTTTRSSIARRMKKKLRRATDEKFQNERAEGMWNSKRHLKWALSFCEAADKANWSVKCDEHSIGWRIFENIFHEQSQLHLISEEFALLYFLPFYPENHNRISKAFLPLSLLTSCTVEGSKRDWCFS